MGDVMISSALPPLIIEGGAGAATLRIIDAALPRDDAGGTTADA